MPFPSLSTFFFLYLKLIKYLGLNTVGVGGYCFALPRAFQRHLRRCGDRIPTVAAHRYLHTSAYVSIRQHTSADRIPTVATHRHLHSALVSGITCVSLLVAYVSIRQHTSAYVSIRQHTSADVSAVVAETHLERKTALKRVRNR